MYIGLLNMAYNLMKCLASGSASHCVAFTLTKTSNQSSTSVNYNNKFNPNSVIDPSNLINNQEGVSCSGERTSLSCGEESCLIDAVRKVRQQPTINQHYF